MSDKEVKYSLLKRKLKELLKENSELSDKLDKTRQKLNIITREKDLLLDRLAKDQDAAKEFVANNLMKQSAASDGSASDQEMSLDSERLLLQGGNFKILLFRS